MSSPGGVGSILMGYPPGGGTGGGSAGTNTLGISNLGNTVGTSGVITGSNLQFLLAGGNNITLSQSINGSSATVTISAFTQTVQTQMTGLTAGMSTGGNTAGTTGLVSNRFVFVGSDNITLSQSVNGQSATLSIFGAAAGTAGATFSAGVSTDGNSAGTTGVVTNRIVFVGGSNITLSQSVNGGSATLTVHGLTNGFVQSLDGSVGQLTLVAGNLMSISNNASTISVINLLSSSNIANPVSSASNAGALSSRFALADHAHAGLNSISVAGNTAGNTSAGAGSLVLAGGSNVTLSGATAGGGMTLSVVGASGGAGAAITLSRWNNFNEDSGASAFTSHGIASVIGSMLVFPLHPGQAYFPGAMTPSTVLLKVFGNPAGSSSYTASTTLGIYTLENSTRLNLLYQALTTFGTTSATNQSTALRGVRFLSIHSSLFSDSASVATTPAFALGSTYYGAMLISTSNQSKAQSLVGKIVGALGTGATAQISGTFGASGATAASLGWEPFLGLYGTAAIPQAISLSSVSGNTDIGGFVPHVIFENIFSAYG